MNQTRNPPASSMAEQAPKRDRAIQSTLDEAVDETFPASDPVSLSDPTRNVRGPTLPADARPGDIVGADGGVAVPREARQPRAPESSGVLRWVWPWVLIGVLMQIWWLRRDR